MLLVIVGAGASYDSFSDELPEAELPPIARAAAAISRRRGRPPLTTELFTTRFENFIDEVPEATALIGRLRRITNVGVDIEEYLESVQRDAESDPELLRQLAAIQMYIFAVISACSSQWSDETHGVTNYAELVERLRQWSLRVSEEHSFVSFNYDDLLDRAWSERYQRRELTSVDDYLQLPILIHPHGCIRWFRPIMNVAALTPESTDSLAFRNRLQVLQPRDIIDAFPGLKLGDAEYSAYFRRDSLVVRWAPITVGFPAVAIPLKTKSSFVCPSTHIAHVQERFSRLTKVLIVGWRAGEDHFMRLWRDYQGDAKPQILIACGKGGSGRETAESLARWEIRGSVEVFDGGFSRLTASDALDEFLGGW